MKKSKKKNNTLIKRKNLILRMKKAGIKRVSPDAVYLLERDLEKNLSNIIEKLKEEIIIQGRKTIKKSDINKIFSKTKEEYWEI